MTISTPALTDTDLAERVAETVAANVRASANERRAATDDSDLPGFKIIEKAVRDVVGPLLHETFEKIRSQFGVAPHNLLVLRDEMMTMEYGLDAGGKAFAHAFTGSLQSLKRAEAKIGFSDHTGGKIKNTFSGWADELTSVLSSLASINGKLDHVEADIVSPALNLLGQLKDINYYFDDQLWGPMGFVIDRLEISPATKAVETAVHNIESALKPKANRATSNPKADDDTRKILVGSLLAASALTSTTANAFNYAAATMPVTLSVNGEIGVAIGVAGDVGVAVSPFNLGAATLGLIGAIFNIFNDIIGSFMNVLDDLVPA